MPVDPESLNDSLNSSNLTPSRQAAQSQSVHPGGLAPGERESHGLAPRADRCTSDTWLPPSELAHRENLEQESVRSCRSTVLRILSTSPPMKCESAEVGLSDEYAHVIIPAKSRISRRTVTASSASYSLQTRFLRMATSNSGSSWSYDQANSTVPAFR